MLPTETSTELVTAEEFVTHPNRGRLSELVRGRIVNMNMPAPRHGILCSRISHFFLSYLDEHPLGEVPSNDSGVITERGPDTVRGADVSYYSHQRAAPGTLGWKYVAAVPEIVFEVISPDDRWTRVLRKVDEYLEAGVMFVCVVDDLARTVAVYSPDGQERLLGVNDALEFPALLPGFAIALSKLFR